MGGTLLYLYSAYFYKVTINAYEGILVGGG